MTDPIPAADVALPPLEFYALEDARGPISVFRLRLDDAGGSHLEQWNSASGGWLPGPSSLLAYVFDGADGASKIDLATADRLISSGLLRV